MHTGLILASLVLAAGASLGCLALLRAAPVALHRRAVQVLGLALPVVVVALLATLMAHFFGQVCFWTAPPGDVLLAQLLSVAGAVSLGGALLLGGLRAALLPWHLHRHTWPAPAWLQAQVVAGAPQAGAPPLPRVRVAADVRPWAWVADPLRPHLVVSSGLLALLEAGELRAVVAHELLHLRRRDLWWTVLGGALCDLTWFLPPTRRLYAQLVAEQEIACDEAVQDPAQRLVLASALARVWQAQLTPAPAPRSALPLLDRTAPASYEARVRRLLTRPGGAPRPAPLLPTLGILVGMLGLIVGTQLSLTQLVMLAMGCGLHQIVPRLH